MSAKRQTLLALTLAAVAIAASWWTHRRTIDSRIVGTWQLEGQPRVGVTYSAEGWFVLLRDGKPLWTEKHNRWFVRDGVLHKVLFEGDLVGTITMQWMNCQARLHGYQPLPTHYERQLGEVSDAAMTFRDEGDEKWIRVR